MIVEDGALIPENYPLTPDYMTWELTTANMRSVKFKAEEERIQSRASLFIGCRGDATHHCNQQQLFGAFNFTKAFVYQGERPKEMPGSWAVEIELPEDFTEDHTVTVVDCGDVIAYYMNTGEEDYYRY